MTDPIMWRELSDAEIVAPPTGRLSTLWQKLCRALMTRAGTQQTRALRHVETLPLPGKGSLLLVECDGERFLITATGHHLSAPVATVRRDRPEGAAA